MAPAKKPYQFKWICKQSQSPYLLNFDMLSLGFNDTLGKFTVRQENKTKHLTCLVFITKKSFSKQNNCLSNNEYSDLRMLDEIDIIMNPPVKT